MYILSFLCSFVSRYAMHYNFIYRCMYMYMYIFICECSIHFVGEYVVLCYVVQDKDIRIILAYMYEDKARETVCQVWCTCVHVQYNVHMYICTYMYLVTCLICTCTLYSVDHLYIMLHPSSPLPSSSLPNLSQAIHKNLTSENHLWIFPAWFRTDWWNQNITFQNKEESCTPEMV